eukprot:CAMPEP_0181180376 /NCGR_PEP_ID=MMETSP1096-20121128/6764_1 /TAXON_ID=156174 ORGANISM="Chrysochromulina ericina, Strain CCMP281" /NCGR_SAMPLE_ID=MMETSP1096 /ASSEMBLY_ACC=CAM_ASM_000453 /LENGTH=64 /DNA_ID=CAMNT_0023268795 /DNA_START=1172 /DNA_END=1367 /DNA_ORIENTATION=+
MILAAQVAPVPMPTDRVRVASQRRDRAATGEDAGGGGDGGGADGPGVVGGAGGGAGHAAVGLLP